ncbi:hypothetical protein ACP70R_041115 [Stipagrostis hirtigluma subsp. patula]
MSRFLRHAALAAAAAVGLSSAASWNASARPFGPLQLSASPSSPSELDPNAATGHLALVRAHPGLRELNAMLTPAAFLVDATHALLAGALRRAPFYAGSVRYSRHVLSAKILSAESDGDADQAAGFRIDMAILDARDCRLEDALAELARVAAERPGHGTPRVYAAALCHVLGRPEEGNRWLRDAAVPDLSRLEHKLPFMEAVLVGTIGCAPRAVEGSEELVLASMLGLVEMAMWCVFEEGDLSDRIQVLALMAFLRGVVARRLRKDDAPAPQEASHNATPPQDT